MPSSVRSFLFSCGIFLLHVCHLGAQELVSFDPPDSIAVCQQGVYRIVLEDVSPGPLLVTCDLPDGFEYLEGNVLSGSEVDITDPTRPQFEMVSLGADEFELVFRLSPGCEVYDLINSGTLFTMRLLTGGRIIDLPPLDVQTPFLVLSPLPRLFLTPGIPEDFPIEVQNTRQGILKSGFLRVELPASLEVQPSDTSWVNRGFNIWELQVDSAVLGRQGNNDGIWDPEEWLRYNFIVLHGNCQENTSTHPVSASASWGCDGICQEDLETSVILLGAQSETRPTIRVEVDTLWNPCFCEEAPSQVCITVINESNIGAIDLVYLWIGNRQDRKRPHSVDSSSIVYYPESSGDGVEVLAFIDSLVDPSGRLRTMQMNIPRLGAGDTMRFCFDMYTLDNRLSKRWMGFSHSLTFKSECPPFRTGSAFCPSVNGPFFHIVSYLDIPVNLLQDGNVVQADIVIDTVNQQFANGTMEMYLVVPPGIRFIDSSFIYKGQSPVIRQRNGRDWFLRYEGEYSGYTNRIPFSFTFSCDELLEDFSTDTCITLWEPPFGGEPIGDQFPAVSFCLYTAHIPCMQNTGQRLCGVDTATIRALAIECDSIPYCLEEADRFWTGDLSLYRVNLGLRDNDNDRIADGPEKADHPEIRKDRFIAGDTMEVRFDGTLRTIGNNKKADTLEWTVFFIAGWPYPDGSTPDSINTAEFFKRLRFDTACIELESRMTENYLKFPLPMPDTNLLGSAPFCGEAGIAVTPVPGKGFAFRIGPEWFKSKGLSGYKWEADDRIKLYARYIIGHNPLPDQEILNFAVGDRLFTGEHPRLVKFSPGPRYTGFQLIASRMYVAAETNLRDGCEPGETGRMFQWRMNPGLNNAFPFEYRNIYLPGYLRMPRLFDMTVEDVFWELFHEENSVQRKFREWPALYLVGSDEIVFEFPEREEPIWDENVVMLLRLTYRMELCLPFQPSATVGNWLSSVDLYDDNIVRKGDLTDSLFTDSIGWTVPVQARPVRADLDIDIPNTLVTPGSDTASWEFTFDYSGLEPGMILGFQLSNDRFEWIDIISQGSRVGDLKNNYEYVWDPGNPSGTLNAFLRLRQLSCIPDGLWLRYGWRCPDQPDFCFTDSILIFSRPQGVEFELQVTGPTDEVELCEDYAYHEIWFYNADRGSAYFPVLEALLPPGLEYVPGSTEIRVGPQVIWQSAEDPTAITGLISWQAGRWLANGLLGSVDNAPDHQIFLRFLTRPVCGFVSGDRVLFRGFGDNRCGDRANQIERPGPALRINTGVTLPPIDLAWAGEDSVKICSESAQLAWNLDLSAPSSGLDSIWIYLPSGSRYIAGTGSWSTGQQVAVRVDSLSSRVRIVAGIPVGFEQGSFSIRVSFDPALSCGPLSIEAQTVQSVQLTCGSDPAPCPVYELTGRTSSLIHLEKNQYSISGATTKLDLSGRQLLDLTLRKNSDDTGGVTVHLFADRSLSGLRDSNDIFIHSFSIPDSLWIGDELYWSGVIPDSISEYSCAILLVVPASDNCLCEDLVIPIEKSEYVAATDTICPGQIWNVGIDSLPGYSYRWNSTELFIPCIDCPNNQIIVNGAEQEYALRLDVMDPFGCSFRYRFGLSTLSGAPDFPEDTLICKGQALAIPVLQGYSWEWSGPNISDPGSKLQILETDTSAIYRVIWSRLDGCEFEDSLYLRVIPPPAVTLDSLTIICTGTSLELIADVNGLIKEYEWSPRSAFEDFQANPAMLRPGSRPDQVSVLVVDSAGCLASDTTILSYSDLRLPVDTITYRICAGDSLAIQAENVPDFTWASSSPLSCDTCKNVIWTPTQSSNLLFIANDSLGCQDTLVHAAQLLPNVSLRTPILFCDGDTIEVEDTLLTRPGFYQFEYQTKEGCDSIMLYDLSFYSIDTPSIEGPIDVVVGDTVRWIVTGGMGYEWSGPFGYLDCDDCPEINFSVVDSGYITLRFLSQEGCEVVLRRKINVRKLECPEAANVFVPNAFSPNGDGVNDQLLIRGHEDAEVFLLIYNRWGQEVFRTRDASVGWDGRFGGSLLEPDTYSYYLELKCPNGVSFQKKGNVTILR